jgi:outer membrane protein assembly factor BamB
VTRSQLGGLLLALGLAAGPACSGPDRWADPASAMPREEVGLPVFSMAWQYQVSNKGGETLPQEFASPVVFHDYLFVGSDGGDFLALAEKDGERRWTSKLGSVSSRPVVDDRGLLFVGTDDGYMVCIDTESGKERWRYATRGPILEAPVLAEGLIFFTNEADQAYALDPETGKYRWQYKSESPDEYTLRGHAGVTIDNGLLFTGFANGTLVALRTATGSVAWMTSLKGDADTFVDVDGTPVVAGDDLYVTSSAGGVYAVDKNTGLVKWRRPIEGAGAVAVDDQRLYVAAAEQGIYALDHRGNILWRQGTRGGGEPAALVLSGDYLIYALSDAGLFVADRASGVTHEWFDPGNGISAAPAGIGVHDDGVVCDSIRLTSSRRRRRPPRSRQRNSMPRPSVPGVVARQATRPSICCGIVAPGGISSTTIGAPSSTTSWVLRKAPPAPMSSRTEIRRRLSFGRRQSTRSSAGTRR